MVIQKALHNVKPSFELRKARIGGSTQFIPAALPLNKQENKAIRTLILNASIKQKKNSSTQKYNDMYSFAYFLAMEIYDAHKNEFITKQKILFINKLRIIEIISENVGGKTLPIHMDGLFEV